MSLFRTIFAFENDREMANLGFVFIECPYSAFALGSLWVRSGSTPKIGDKVNPKRDEKDLDVV